MHSACLNLLAELVVRYKMNLKVPSYTLGIQNEGDAFWA